MIEGKDLYEIFKADVLSGLSSIPKRLPSKYFYDEKGSQIFQKIMRMPDYYLTDAEYEVFHTKKEEILEVFGDHFEMVELGAGDGLKTKVLIQHFIQKKIHFSYLPVDISWNALVSLKKDLNKSFPELDVRAQHGDYLEMLHKLNEHDHEKKIILFLGSNIGNYSFHEAVDFFKQLGNNMHEDDLVFIGFDLKKDPQLILKAYDDPHGYTASFNLNLLQRINHELEADFNTENFLHAPNYDVESGAARSYLLSKQQQYVYIKALDQIFEFDAWESIFTEISQKYDKKMIESLANASGFELRAYFSDPKKFFTNCVWKLKK